MDRIDCYFKKVRPIIYKLMRSYYIQLWDKDDWLQEGRVVLHNLLSSHPDLCHNEKLLLVYFKTKFSSHLKDVIRSQESQKRRFNRMPYEEIGEIAHKIPSQGLTLDEFVAYQSIIEQISGILSKEEQTNLYALMRGERFVGRKALLKKIKPFFIDFLDD
ncbi:sigma-70 family RNA polymerase sigma factor [Streptococcus hongkongensis]|nr:competence protein ComX [Streptococcus uberis]